MEENNTNEFDTDEEIKDIVIDCEKDKEIKLGPSFRWVLGISIGLTGILSMVGLGFISFGISERVWQTEGVTFFCNQILFYLSILVCFTALISIAVVKRPFSRILTGCIMTIGVLFVTASIVFPRFTGYKNSGFQILSRGSFTLIDGFFLLIGLLIILFAKLLRYGFQYQNNSDMIL